MTEPKPTKREEALARAVAENKAEPFKIEPGYEEEARPLTARQEAVLKAVHVELGLTAPLDVLPPTDDDGSLTASATDPSRTRFAIDVDREGYLDRVAVRYEVAGKIGWAKLDSLDPVRDTLNLIARAARLATPINTEGTNAVE